MESIVIRGNIYFWRPAKFTQRPLKISHDSYIATSHKTYLGLNWKRSSRPPRPVGLLLYLFTKFAFKFLSGSNNCTSTAYVASRRCTPCFEENQLERIRVCQLWQGSSKRAMTISELYRGRDIMLGTLTVTRPFLGIVYKKQEKGSGTQCPFFRQTKVRHTV